MSIPNISRTDSQPYDSTSPVVVVVGLGEVGRPLFNLLSTAYDCVGVDLAPVHIDRPCSVLHLCIPYQIRDFIGVCADYVAKYQPQLTVLHSTIAPGTTRALQEATASDRVVFSPVRGKHARMESDMLRYKKFVAASTPEIAAEAAAFLQPNGRLVLELEEDAAASASQILLDSHWDIESLQSDYNEKPRILIARPAL